MIISKRQKGIKYAKIPKKHKVLFLKKVIQDKSSLKSVTLSKIIQTAKLFKINYSTAKTLLRQFRQDTHKLQNIDCSDTQSNFGSQKSQNLQRCNFKERINMPSKINDPAIIKFSDLYQTEDDRKKIQKYGLILVNPQNKNKSQVQIVSKILFS